MKSAWRVVLASVLLASGCGGEADVTSGAPDTPGASATSVPTSPATGAPEVGTDRCRTKDGAVEVALDLRDDALVATFRFADPDIAMRPTIAVHVNANNFGGDGNGPSIQGMAKALDGGLDVGIFDFSTSTNRNSAGKATRSRGEIQVEFDSDPFRRLGEGWSWSAAVTDDGQDLYLCPGSYGEYLKYKASQP